MRTIFRPRPLALTMLAMCGLASNAAIIPYSGAQGDKALVLDPNTLSPLEDLVTKAAIVPPIGTEDGTPGAALTSFGAAIDRLGTIGFESSSAGSPGEIGFGGNTATFSGGTVIDGNASDTDFMLGRYNMTGYEPNGTSEGGLDQNDLGKWLEATASFDITFQTAIGAFGFFGTDFSDFGGNVTMSLLDTNGNVIASNLKPPTGADTNAGLIFYGLTSTTAIKTVSFEITQQTGGSTDVLGFDEFIFGNLRQTDPEPPNPAPEPGTLALAGLSLLGLVAARRRRRG